ncbi:single-stranded-DNA-specific exonuclease RecJ [Candidatus Parcubacteria bacterium]|nr:single-stranded-DNA-specific exonuclease RecJ [Candidatus Parcubacteria bacterium]
MEIAYRVREPAPPLAHAEFAAYPELIRNLLYHRGLRTRAEAEAFLTPSYDLHTHDPLRIAGMEKAVERILRAIKDEERIVVYSDYDHDGIPGGVILHDFFKKIAYPHFENYIPHRYIEGYGLNSGAVEKLAESGAKLLITVDCGITDVEPVVRANELGLDVIITDHHLSFGELPPAYVILNSKQEHCDYPYDMLCGAAVAWKLVQALIAKGDFGLTEGWEKWLLDLVGLSTVADMVPLTGENRVLAHYGLRVLRKTPRPGLLKLLRIAGVKPQDITEDDVGFTIAPRINAASRMGDPRLAFDLLSASEGGAGETLARELNRLNDARKGMVGAMVKEMKRTFALRAESPVIVMGNPEWRPGLLGLAANNLMEAYRKPVFLWGREGGETIKGSCRSDGTVNLVSLMQAVPLGTFREFGGHALSGGFSLLPEAVHHLEAKLSEAYGGVKEEVTTKEAEVDALISIKEITPGFWRELLKLAPFGIGNPKPLFMLERVEISGVKRFGKEKNHLELALTDGFGAELRAIRFFTGEDPYWNSPLFELKRQVSVLGHLEAESFGKKGVRMRLVDVRAA